MMKVRILDRCEFCLAIRHKQDLKMAELAPPLRKFAPNCLYSVFI
jgi:hypothetical protein